MNPYGKLEVVTVSFSRQYFFGREDAIPRCLPCTKGTDEWIEKFASQDISLVRFAIWSAVCTLEVLVCTCELLH